MDKKKTEKYETKLLEEKKLLEKELLTVGRKDVDDPGEWEATAPDENLDTADRNNVADEITDYENNNSILGQLEARLFEINKALEKIEQGTYGICEISGERIEEDRLDANPAARTCKKHINEKI